MRLMRLPVLCAALCASTNLSAATFVYANFNSTAGLQLNGAAAQANDGSRNVLRVTPSEGDQKGSAFTTSPITLADDYSFSTRFTFNFNSQANGGADGLVFVVQTNNNNVGGLGGGIGYQGVANSVGIEFDSWDNTVDGIADGGSDNHIGINTGGNINSHVLVDASPFQLDGGTDLTAWIDYNSLTDLLEVRLNNSNLRPVAPSLFFTVDLLAELGGGDASGLDAYVGFTSGTGGAQANHDVVNWTFNDSFAPIDGVVPEPATWAMMIIGFGTVGAAMRRSRRSQRRVFSAA